ncbi:DUF935 domain-containing protein [Paenibacillus melissococcoides]|nr:DUF935 domain-containing protein [Paenibacillus melissococcoides]
MTRLLSCVLSFQIGTDAAGIIPDGTEIEFKEAAKTTSINVYESLAMVLR